MKVRTESMYRCVYFVAMQSILIITVKKQSNFLFVAVKCLNIGSTVVSPYVGMARKQNGGYNASISVQTLIFHLVVNSTRLKTVRSGRWCCPNYTMAPGLVENVVKVTNLEVVKIEFRHLPFLLSFFSQPSALT